MKNLIFYLIFLVPLFINCDLFAQDHNYKMQWHLNPEKDMFKYERIIYISPDSSYSNPTDTTYFYHDSLAIQFPDSTVITTFPSPENGQFISFQLVAIDSALNRSIPAFSNILRKDDLTPPAQPQQAQTYR